MDTYCLIAALGRSPAVLSETVWSLAQEGRVPTEVHVLTTATGASDVQDRLLSPGGGSARPRWDQLCLDVLSLDAPVPVTVHVAKDETGTPLNDVRDAAADLRFGGLCYRLVQSLTESADTPPLVGSVAGGRKTMGAHLTTAFSLWARPADELVHVLVPPAYERADVYWPTPDTPDFIVDRVDLPFPRVRAILESHQFADRLADRTGLYAVLEILADYNVVGTPTAVRVWLASGDDGRTRVEILGADGTVLGRSASFTTRMASLFLLLADETAAARRRHGGPRGAVALSDLGNEPSGPLIDSDVVTERLAAVYRWCHEHDLPTNLGVWETPADVSQAIGKLHDRHGLRDPGVPPLIQDRLRFKTSSGTALHAQGVPGVEPDRRRYWHWAASDLPVSVVASPLGSPRRDGWPFDHVPRPVPFVDAAIQ